MLTRYDYDRMMTLHQEDLLREAQHARLVVTLEALRSGRPGVLAPLRRRIGQALVVLGMRLQTFPADITQVEYVMNTPVCAE